MDTSIAPAVEVPTKDYRGTLRFWHWANATLISLQLMTILFQKVIVRAKTAVPELQSSGKEVSVPQARELAHIISERIWAWHIYFGWTIIALWVFRLGLQLTGPSELRFSARLMEILRRYRLAPPAEKGKAGKILFAKTTYALFYLFITIMVCTGLILVFEDVSWLKGIHHTAEEIHNVTMFLIIGFILIHVVGVVWAEISEDHGLISRMVGGEAKKAKAA
ncbi:cytochrome b/b6 domain-containing protein [Hymenobacter convexus]|uniref:cytochrome b/b6 domain-containing protein n=1 Tax=Hymenobacter sp. CA1UV-4 TaxID=3063782 RepID=UPI0027137BBC|nr:cytochrome b/b6 domain-containing protein [Hymenobacter sp. CA1UV-4]MDO7853581.1 cytochrome b/b6 domain-containing protein [Hymenobacter sp. CA1UV-4]